MLMPDQQTLIIHKFEVLFNILMELKIYLNFKIKLVNTKKIDEKRIDKNCLIISGEKNFKLTNQIKINEYPIDIIKLVEIININFLKHKFNQQNNIRIGKYIINLNSRVMNKDSKKLSLTEKEAKIIVFLNNSKNPVPITDLQKEVWDHKSKLETHTVETHIYRLRKKIEKKFRDKLFIISFKDGYKLNA
tara:strand:+ start:46 stop:615 length:570 start_codon:yes stop_codon:yes gene_type:complete